MPPVRLKHLERGRDRQRRVKYLWFRNRAAGGPRIPLRGPEGSPEFLEDYHAALAGTLQPVGPANAPAQKGTMLWLVQSYFQSGEFRQLAPGTRKQKESVLLRFCNWRPEKGAKPVAERPYRTLRPAHLRVIRDTMLETPQAANNMLKTVKTLYSFAIRYELATENPAAGVESLISNNPDGHHAWTLAEVQQFARRWPPGTKQHLAMALLLMTGLRRSDVVRIGQQHVRDGWLILREEKRGRGQAAKLNEIEMIPALQEIIDASPTGDLTFLVTEYGKPFSRDGFGNWFRDACDAAGLSHCSAHGLRKALMTILAELGGTAHMIQAIGNWTSLAEPTRYTRSVDRRRLATQASALLQTAFSQTPLGSSQTGGKDKEKQVVGKAVVTPRGIEPLFST